MREREREITTQANQSKSPETKNSLFSLYSVSLGDLVMEKKSLTNDRSTSQSLGGSPPGCPKQNRGLLMIQRWEMVGKRDLDRWCEMACMCPYHCLRGHSPKRKGKGDAVVSDLRNIFKIPSFYVFNYGEMPQQSCNNNRELL